MHTSHGHFLFRRELTAVFPQTGTYISELTIKQVANVELRIYSKAASANAENQDPYALVTALFAVWEGDASSQRGREITLYSTDKEELFETYNIASNRNHNARPEFRIERHLQW
jgi:hypothetical protein